jgi:hypothetical protein
MPDPRAPEPLADAVRRLATSLSEVSDWLKLESPTEPTFAPLVTDLAPVIVAVRAVPPAPVTSGPAVHRAEWLHAVREHVTAIVGWVAVIRQTRNGPTRQRGVAAIARNTGRLADLLKRRPA